MYQYITTLRAKTKRKMNLKKLRMRTIEIVRQFIKALYLDRRFRLIVSVKKIKRMLAFQIVRVKKSKKFKKSVKLFNTFLELATMMERDNAKNLVIFL